MKTLILEDSSLCVVDGRVPVTPVNETVLWTYVTDLPETPEGKKLSLTRKGTADENGNGDIAFVDIPQTELINAAKISKLSELSAYDGSPEVNGFTLNGKTLWLDATTRAKFRMAMEAARALSQNSIELVLPEAGIEATIPTDTGLNMLNRLELYAAGCAIAAKKHQIAIQALDTTEALTDYDFKTGYPAPLTFTI